MDMHVWYEHCYKDESDYLFHKKYQDCKNSSKALYDLFSSSFALYIEVGLSAKLQFSGRQLIKDSW